MEVLQISCKTWFVGDQALASDWVSDQVRAVRNATYCASYSFTGDLAYVGRSDGCTGLWRARKEMMAYGYARR